MSPEQQEINVTAGTLQWLQDEVHSAKAHAAKLEQQIEQLQALHSDLVDRSRHQDEALAGLSAQLTALSSFQEEINQMQALSAKLRDEQERARAHVEEATRQQQAENERFRTERADFIRRLQDAERQVASWLERQNGVEETGRRYQETASAAAQSIAGLGQRLDDLESRVGRTLEAVNRLEQKLPEVEAALADAVRAGETSSERSRLLADVVRRLESDIAEQQQQFQGLTDLSERLELQRAERQRLETRFSQLEESVNGLSGVRDDHQRLLAALEGKHHGYEGRLDALNDRMDEQRQQLSEFLLKLTQNQEQLKRRQIADLEHEIKELEQHALGLFRE